ncbi:MAG: enoyl-CoA hydratase/isomerase family protein, partial [Pseudomonadota bacterium]|nr:enoyl-CoA hydratase/isomerase family protein [Pseudomonadota bacterium]
MTEAVVAEQGEDILYERRGRAGVITLNRPEALNAVTFDMVRRLDAILDEAERD